ncbi:hypothetical protein KSC_081570 [Ktedonobacter sp. SOSP1-52]|uniref:hypothetical protein n=1 Tax=Ktedonobacter sp. SOSP1-52 TaxID=2778366 RepID=UPI0019157B6F|nr:hypothetical protein [Ktedonobacter sp. SOSP1-52]GHO69265.1 hypothetical protein KSC_081570 [Ktedonobacter sp. SOSP1-52]
MLLMTAESPVINSINDASVFSPERDINVYLEHIWKSYFADIQPVNEVCIAYCYPWKTRLGVIRMTLDENTSFIGINSLLQVAQVPECVLITTIAHELVHYVHGFGSPRPRLYQHPHANSVVDKELEQRSLGEQLYLCNEWVDKEWYPFYDKQQKAGWVSWLSARYSARRGRRSR